MEYSDALVARTFVYDGGHDAIPSPAIMIEA